MAIVVALVAIAVPTCQMVGCDMEMGAMPFVPFSGTHMSADCPGQWEFFTTPASTLPSGSDTLLLTLVAALVGAVVLFAPQIVGASRAGAREQPAASARRTSRRALPGLDSSS